jgi:hypothetical protein
MTKTLIQCLNRKPEKIHATKIITIKKKTRKLNNPNLNLKHKTDLSKAHLFKKRFIVS